MMMFAALRIAAIALMVMTAACASRHAPATVNRPPATDRIPVRAERAIDTLLASFDRDAAMGHVAFIGPKWRLAGNDAFDQSIDRIRERMRAAGFAGDARVHEYPNPGHGWDHSVGTLAIVRPDGSALTVLSKETHRVALAINSFSTPAGGRTLRLVDVGAGDIWPSGDLKDTLVLGDASLGALWKEATSRGAAGVVSTTLPSYIVPTPPGDPVPPREEWDILQWGSIPYDAEKRGFAFKASPRAAADLRRALAAGEATVRVTIASTFTERPARMLIAEIPGTIRPDERIVIAAHVQEPGANDNASGTATLAELAVAMRKAIADGALPAPARTITFLWLDEISGSRRWIADFPDQATQVKWMFSLDMTGEDIEKTGGSFLVERWPDPGALYDRAWDPHSEWGKSKFDTSLMKGDVINDLHLAIARRVGARTGWVVRSNPYEGGSDHTVFGSRGIPSLLDWHFTDRYYHTNFDTIDKVSDREMRNVAAAVGATAWLMASATGDEAAQVGDLVAAAGRARLARERAESAPDRDAAVAAWERWYAEAVASAARLDTTGRPDVPPTRVSITPVPGIVVDAPASDGARTTRESVLLAEDRRASAPGDYERLVAAASRGDAGSRETAIRALGRLEQRHPSFEATADLIQQALTDRNAMIRRTAAYALAQSVTARDASARAPRRAALLAALSQEPDAAVVAALMESAARLADPASIAEVEAAILARAVTPLLASGAASALEVLSRRAGRDGRLGDASIAWLRAATLAPATAPAARREAVLALTASRAIDPATAETLFGSRDWQMRRLALLAAPTDAGLINRALADADAHVRLEAARLYGRNSLPAGSCAPLIAAARDADTHVALAAIDALARCEDTTADDPLAALAATPGGTDWHRASHALVSLASLDRPRARALLPAHMADAAWPVRMYAAEAAWRVLDDAALESLAGDAHPNVRQAAIRNLTARARQGMATGFPADLEAGRRARLHRAIASALTDLRDPQLILTAAAGVKESGDPASLTRALLDAIAALDAEGADTTIDARVALVDALKAAAPDTAPPPPPAARAPETPSAQELRRLPVRARVEMARGGVFELELLPGEAPATVARFARLARAGYYDRLTFHRVVPNFVVQGGSPWANEYAGAPRFQRDELGFARHERGAVGISTRGRDTGDAQIFIDLVDLPRLNHDYTVFARVVSGMDVVDGILEADVIRSVVIVK